MTVDLTAPWWIAHPNTGCGRRASLGLRDRGFETWLPVTWREVRTNHHARHANACRAVPIAGYIFVRHSHSLAWPEMIGVDGLRGIRVWEGTLQPQTVSADQIEVWRDRLLPRHMAVVEDAFRIGSEVRVLEGPMAGFMGTVERLVGRGGVEIATSLFGRSARLQMAREQIEALP